MAKLAANYCYLLHSFEVHWSIFIAPENVYVRAMSVVLYVLQATDDTHCDKPNLSAAVPAMTEVAAAINEYKRRKDLGKFLTQFC